MEYKKSSIFRTPLLNLVQFTLSENSFYNWVMQHKKSLKKDPNANTPTATLADTSSPQTSTLSIATGGSLFPLYNRKPADQAFSNHNNGVMSPPLKPANPITIGANCKTALSPLTFGNVSPSNPRFHGSSPSRPSLVGRQEPINSKDSVQGCIAASSLMCENGMQRTEFPQWR